MSPEEWSGLARTESLACVQSGRRAENFRSRLARHAPPRNGSDLDGLASVRFRLDKQAVPSPDMISSSLSGRVSTRLAGRCFRLGIGRTRSKVGEYPKPESELLCPPVAMRREGAPSDCGRGCLSPQSCRCLCSFRHGPLLQGGVAVEGVQQIGTARRRMVRCRTRVRCRQLTGDCRVAGDRRFAASRGFFR